MSQKFITARIKKISYAGNNIGSNLIFNLKIGNLAYEQKIELKLSQKKENIQLFREFIDGEQTNISCQLKESDPIFDDFSEIKSFNILLDGDSVVKKNITFVITEKEIAQQKNTAYITIELEFDISDTIFYVGLVDDGWLKFIDRNTIDSEKINKISLPYGTKIQLIGKDKKYLYFIAKEGPNANGTELAISIKNITYLLSDIKYKQAVKLIYSIGQKTLQIHQNKYPATEDPSNLLKKGSYKLFIADFPHKYGGRYKQEAKHAKTWFRLNDKDKYLHVGRISAGCITITDLEKWDEIYHQIILARTGDDETIGVIEVID